MTQAGEASRADPAVVKAVSALLNEALASVDHRPLVIGICGSQASGKSTLAAALVAECDVQGIAAASLSIDDIYLTHAERQRLGATVHPLLATRGVPGTHDIGLGLRLLDRLAEGEEVALPRFEKGRDDRAPANQWPKAPAGCEVLIFEGWCVGARPQAAEQLAKPVNDLEANEDPDGVWRTYANDTLAGPYQQLFDRIDRLVLLAAPDFDVVLKWRLQQEEELGRKAGPDAPRLMDAAGVARFIAHYERLTRHILAEMPGRADLVISLDRKRNPIAIERKAD